MILYVSTRVAIIRTSFSRRASAEKTSYEPRSASVPPVALKSALCNTHTRSSPGDDDGTPKQKKSAHFPADLAEIDAALRRTATDTLIDFGPPTDCDAERVDLPIITTEQPLPRTWSGVSDNPWLHESFQYDNDHDENAYQREAIDKFYGSMDRRKSLEDDSEADEARSSYETAACSAEHEEEGDDASNREDPDEDSRGSARTISDDEEAHNGSDGDENEHEGPFEFYRDQRLPKPIAERIVASNAVNDEAESPSSKSDMEGEDVVCTAWSTRSFGETCEMPPICEASDDAPTCDETEYIPCGSQPMVEPGPVRRASYTEAEKPKRGRRMTKTDDHRRYSSLTELCRMKSRIRSPSYVAPKASPARPAVTAISVHPSDSPRLTTVHEHPVEPQRTAQTVQSDLGLYQMLWEEPPPSRKSSVATTYTDPDSGVEFILFDENDPGATTPMIDHVKTKLTAWNWSREVMDDPSEDRLGWRPLPLLDVNRRRGTSSDQTLSGDKPPNPPNTARHSAPSSAKPSQPQSPIVEAADENESDDSPAPIELNVSGLLNTGRSQAQSAYSCVAAGDYLSVTPRRNSLPASPSIPRKLSNLGQEELHFESHRDSVEIVRGHIRRQEAETDHLKPNSLLVTSKDSFLLSKSKLERKLPSASRSPVRHSRGSSPANAPIRWNRSGGLSPILDASPPNQHTSGWQIMQAGKRRDRSRASPRPRPTSDMPDQKDGGCDHAEHIEDIGAVKPSVDITCPIPEDLPHPEQPEGCPICAEDRPRSFATRISRWRKRRSRT
ncbi:hypothetical protein AC578_7598 [Pseudocercospora eumusae]|uniref:Uncharacterized protein n=1 Tax=Pseudocercospora eumusae TaxID=321146 RepID=A0A139HRL7_9PEZI|nr:hypothetical protein AC578_7598 [Pseudocercospora eumusae]